MEPPSPNTWSKSRLLQLINDKVEENLQLEYKRAASLGKQNDHRVEITKDVSAMANAAGGTIIYGIAESSQREQRHIPERLDPIRLNEFSKEWIESVIHTIQPRIEGIKIHVIPDASDSQATYFAIEIPPSETAHQARDQRYYKRFNFSAVPMEDYEVRDTMNRMKHPKIGLSLTLERYIPQDPMGMPRLSRYRKQDALGLEVTAINHGSVMAEFVVAKLSVPILLLDDYEISRKIAKARAEVPEAIVYTLSNQKQDRSPMGNVLSDVRHERILPGLDLPIGWINLNTESLASRDGFEISWTAHADNAQPVVGSISFKDIPLSDNR